VLDDMLRIVMSSITRRRSGVICAVIAELLLLDYTNVQSSQTGCSAATSTSPSSAIRKGRETAIVRRIGNGSTEPYSLNTHLRVS
jgi:hypothetical protein